MLVWIFDWHLINLGWTMKLKFPRWQKWRSAPLVFKDFSTVFLQTCLSKSNAKESQTATKLLTALAHAGPLPQMGSLHCLLTNLPSSFKNQFKWFSALLWNQPVMSEVRPVPMTLNLYLMLQTPCYSHSALHRNSFCIILSSHLAYEFPNHVESESPCNSSTSKQHLT